MAIINDTIAAISTAPGEGGIAIIRLSGPESLSVANKVELSPGDCVVALVPFGSVGVPERLAAVPVVFWFRVGTSPATMALGLIVPAVAEGEAKKYLAG